MYEKPQDNVLAGYSVLDLTDEKGAFCVKTLAGMGAEIVPVNPETEPQRFPGLINKADILIETTPPGCLASLGFAYQDLSKINPRLIMVSITPFGQTGPYKDFKAADLTLQAIGGWLSVTGESNQPLALPGNQAYKTAGLFTANAVLLALWNLHETGLGQHIDISILECMAATLDHVLVRYFYDGIVSGRQGSRTWNNAFDILPCRDGYLLISIHRQWETLVELMASEGMAEDLADVKWLDRNERNKNIEHILAVIKRWTLKHDAGELEEQGQLMHLPWAAVKHE
jgi:crotonobetainyl-CoA:carnitine CoA-transferase CaiB-like acyl-CoA transferase